MGKKFRPMNKRKILVVEDDDLLAQGIVARLEKVTGLSVLHAANGIVRVF